MSDIKVGDTVRHIDIPADVTGFDITVKRFGNCPDPDCRDEGLDAVIYFDDPETGEEDSEHSMYFRKV